MKVWLNGTLVDDDAPALPALDRGFLLADGVFETLLYVDGRACALEAHVDRLHGAAARLDIPLFWKSGDLNAAIISLLHENNLQSGRASARLTLSRGAGGRGLAYSSADTPSLVISTAPAPPVKPAYRLHVSAVRRNEHSPLANLKSLNYGDNILARREAVAHGADEALMLNGAGFVACAAAANIWILAQDIVRTPSLEQGVLPGIVRHYLLDLLPDFGLAVTEGPLSLETVLAADEVFLSNSLIGLRPVSELQDRKYSTARMDAIAPLVEQSLLTL